MAHKTLCLLKMQRAFILKGWFNSLATYAKGKGACSFICMRGGADFYPAHTAAAIAECIFVPLLTEKEEKVEGGFGFISWSRWEGLTWMVKLCIGPWGMNQPLRCTRNNFLQPRAYNMNVALLRWQDDRPGDSLLQVRRRRAYASTIWDALVFSDLGKKNL